MVQNLVGHLQMVIDRAFLGQLDPLYLSAIGNVMTPYSALTLFLVASSTGLTVLVAQSLGAGRIKKAQNLSESSFVFSTLLSTGLCLFWALGADGVFTLLGTQGAVKDAAVTYVTIMAVSLVFLGLDVTSASVLQGAGITLPIMVTGMMKNLINLFLDWVLIFGELGFPALGLAGAAWATVISNVAGTLVLTYWTLRSKKLPFQFTWSGLVKPRFQAFARTMTLGLPSGVESILWFGGQLVLLRMMNDVDPLAAGVVSLVQSVSLLALFIYLGFAKAATTLVGQAWGAGDRRAARRSALVCQLLGLGVSLVWGLAMVILDRPLTALFTHDAALTGAALPILHLSALMILGQTLNVIIGHAIRGTGDTRWMLWSQIAGTVFVVAGSWVSIYTLGWGLAGLYITLIADESGRGLVNLQKFLRSVRGGSAPPAV